MKQFIADFGIGLSIGTVVLAGLGYASPVGSYAAVIVGMAMYGASVCTAGKKERAS